MRGRAWRDLVVVFVLAVAGAALSSCIHETCTGGACAAPPRYDLIYTEKDSGASGISTGETAAFVLDPRRDHLTASPGLRVVADHLWNQIPGKSVWAVSLIDQGNGVTQPFGPGGVFTVTATGSGLPQFSFRLIYGHLLADPIPLSTVNVGDIVVQQWGGGCGTPPPASLAAPDFALIQDATVPVLQRTQFGWVRRAYRAQRVVELQATKAPDYTLGSCLPSDFPRYPSMQSSGGFSKTCTWDIPSNDSPARVIAFYKSQLDQVTWRIASVNGQTIAFRREDNYGFRGTLTVMPDGVVRVSIPYGPPTTCF